MVEDGVFPFIFGKFITQNMTSLCLPTDIDCNIRVTMDPTPGLKENQVLC
jgi:hypothetical protein